MLLLYIYFLYTRYINVNASDSMQKHRIKIESICVMIKNNVSSIVDQISFMINYINKSQIYYKHLINSLLSKRMGRIAIFANRDL
jgi:hypothetical protein